MSKKVLVVDDEEIIRKLAFEIVKMFGYECETAEDGIKALEIVGEYKPDLILLDFYMPSMSGEKVLDALSKDYPGIKVLMTTGKELDDDEAERISKKGACVINKPFAIADLKTKLDEYLS
ncbi:MAG: response regulator [FCB group bacterium]|nr:response regulator [FCB group bacterium]